MPLAERFSYFFQFYFFIEKVYPTKQQHITESGQCRDSSSAHNLFQFSEFNQDNSGQVKQPKLIDEAKILDEMLKDESHQTAKLDVFNENKFTRKIKTKQLLWNKEHEVIIRWCFAWREENQKKIARKIKTPTFFSFVKINTYNVVMIVTSFHLILGSLSLETDWFFRRL